MRRFDSASPSSAGSQLGRRGSEAAANKASEMQVRCDAESVRSVLRTLSPMINAALITPLLGRMDYARLQAMRVAYHADYGRELRDDLKSKIFPTASYGKLMRHVTMSRAEWALKVFKTARALDKKSTATSTRLAAELQARLLLSATECL